MFSEGYFRSPLGWVKLEASEIGLCSLQFVNKKETSHHTEPVGIIDRSKLELDQYFSGKRTRFTIPLDLQGTDFQIRVGQQLLTLPYGDTTSYSALTRSLGNMKSIRAVARANSANRIPVIVPCHRVIGKNGSLTGYAGGLERKKWLLTHEKAPVASQISLF